MHLLRKSILVIVASIFFSFSSAEAIAQSRPMSPRGALLDYSMQSSAAPNLSAFQRSVFTHVVSAPGARWVRVYFSELLLEGASTVRLTSLADGEIQELDAAAAREWSNTSAYFNGDRVLVELLAAPHSTMCRVAIDQIAVELPEEGAEGAEGECGICGSDDRVPSNMNWSARLMPAGCTASVYNSCSHMVSAGHCVSSGMVVQFNVPNSLSNCSLVNPPVADQFPITSYSYSAVDIGDDWAVLATGTNGAGQRPFDRYGLFRPISPTATVSGQTIGLWGYGLDDECPNSQRQQETFGTVDVVDPTYFQFFADVRGGSSGTAIIRGNEIIGVATNCMQMCPNVASAMSIPAFAAARAALGSCGGLTPCAADLTGDLVVNVNDLLLVVQHWGSCPPFPAPCVGNIMLTLPPSVDIQDLLAVIRRWGNCSGHVGPGGVGGVGN